MKIDHQATTPPSAIQLLRARKTLETANQYWADKSAWRQTTSYPPLHRAFIDSAICLAYFQYLTVDITAASHVYETALAYMSAADQWASKLTQPESWERLQHELLHLSYCRLMLVNAIEHVAPPRLLRDVLMNALSVYPSNPELLSLLVVSEARYGPHTSIPLPQ